MNPVHLLLACPEKLCVHKHNKAAYKYLHVFLHHIILSRVIYKWIKTQAITKRASLELEYKIKEQHLHLITRSSISSDLFKKTSTQNSYEI